MSVELVTDIWVDQVQWRQWGGGLHLLVGED